MSDELPHDFVRPSIDLRRYYACAQQLLLQADAGGVPEERQRTLLLRMVSLLHEHMPRHPHYYSPALARWRAGAEKQVRAALDRVEQMDREAAARARDKLLEERAARLGLKVRAAAGSVEQGGSVDYPALQGVLGAAPPSPVPAVVVPPVVVVPATLQLPQSAWILFERAAASNTRADVETCAVLCGTASLLVTHVVLPPQTGASDRCSMTDAGEGALLDYQVSGSFNVRNLFTHFSLAAAPRAHDCRLDPYAPFSWLFPLRSGPPHTRCLSVHAP